MTDSKDGIGRVRRLLRSATKRAEQLQRDKDWEKPKNFGAIGNERWAHDYTKRAGRREIPITLATEPWKDDGKD